ncbi:hypothetical protein bpr_II355 (plasmid) [Butyrivibrio proteoclasticus B316]|uniref:Immunity protein 74 n=1 Tax=Butyrivibrio proteoclasticus (strain ATCC 51982 / DSM 14932 / B316) TaxID=515622 RepID=E0S4G0_BUTPB|nr:Imm74 family immunity protein [Butyrivibrio proteoclasticus]ADL36292.1 hypothetical protein bpr_II355 [Butyrivibrio proteoclasticus B316]
MQNKNKDVRITGTSSYVNIEIDGRRIQISGEMMADGFLAYKGDIKKWDYPEENPVTKEEKQMIIDAVTEKAADSDFTIIFQ